MTKTNKLQNNINQLIGNGRIKLALEHLKNKLDNLSPAYKSVILLSGRFKTLEQDRNNGLISSERYQRELNNISHALLNLNLEQPSPIFPVFQNKYIVFLSLALVITLGLLGYSNLCRGENLDSEISEETSFVKKPIKSKESNIKESEVSEPEIEKKNAIEKKKITKKPIKKPNNSSEQLPTKVISELPKEKPFDFIVYAKNIAECYITVSGEKYQKKIVDGQFKFQLPKQLENKSIKVHYKKTGTDSFESRNIILDKHELSL